LTDLFLYSLIVPILPFMLHDRLSIPHAAIQTNTSLLLACYAGASVIFSLPAGILTDRLSARQLPFLCGIASLFAATLLLWLGQHLWLLIVARILQGLSGAVVWTIGLALVMDTVGSDQLGTAIGSIFSFISVGELLAPVIGGVVYGKGGEAAVFAIGLGLLCIGFKMRFVLIEKKSIAQYTPEAPEAPSDATEPEEEDEDAPLIAGELMGRWIIPQDTPSWIRSFPIAYCLKDPRFLASQAATFTQAMLLAVFDATIPTEAQDLFGFDPLKSGLLFVPLVLPYLLLGPIAGRGVDRFGAKPLAVVGYIWMIPPLVLLRLPKSDNIAMFCVFLALSGIGIALISASGLVEATHVVEKYHKANNDFFGERGPYGQLYAFNSMFFCLGLTIGPLVAGALRQSIGYGT
jgi:MFS family permease